MDSNNRNPMPKGMGRLNFDADYIKNRFLNFPVAINNYYGDPTLQIKNTVKKIHILESENHAGPVILITRGRFPKSALGEFKKLKLKNFAVIVSYSGLGKPFEEIDTGNTLAGLKQLYEAGIPVIVNIRPIFPESNGTREGLKKIFTDLNEFGVRNVIVSGFRGNTEMVCRLTDKERLDWNLRVKLMSKKMSDDINEFSKKFNIDVSRRVSCGVSKLIKKGYSWNPYYNSPILVGCDDCSIQKTCFKHSNDLKINDNIKNFLAYIGYEIEVAHNPQKNRQTCTVTPDNRMSCPSCCTACFVMEGQKIWIKNKNITLADTAFIRFLSDGIIGTQKGIEDCGGNTGIAMVVSKYINKEVHLVNSWFVWSKQLKKCYNCNYCITRAYNINEEENGSSPLQLYNLLMEEKC